MSITIKELAKIAGVSHTLVSGVLSDNPNCRVSQETRNKILKLACQYNCRPNRFARNLRGGKMKTVFILSRSNPAPDHTLLIREAVSQLEKEGYQVFMAQTSSGEQTAQQISEITHFGCDGIISCYTHYVPDQTVKIPMVVISDYSDVPHDTGINREYAAKELTEHLISHGHRRIAFAGCGNWGVQEMIAGYKKALDAHDISDSFIVDYLYNENGLAETIALIREEAVTAITCANDFIAGKLMALLMHQGIRVPEDVAITGSNAMSFSEYTPVPLTTAIYPYSLVGKKAAGLLLDKIAGKSDVEKGDIPPQLHIACSCGCNKEMDDRMFGMVPVIPMEEYLTNEYSWRNNNPENAQQPEDAVNC